MSRFNLAIDALFLLAGSVHALTNEAFYRVAVIAILLMLRAFWGRSVVNRARNNLLNEVDRRRRARASQKTNRAANGQYQDLPLLQRESRSG